MFQGETFENKNSDHHAAVSKAVNDDRNTMPILSAKFS
jgi:hypothetical protein